VDAATVRRWLRDCSSTITAQRDGLTELDAAIGDADHGANMARGFAAVEAKIEGLDDGTPPGRLLLAAGSTLVSTVGGASGPLWGTALRRVGKALGDEPEVSGGELCAALGVGVAAVAELGGAERGDKTMLDSLGPAVEALDAALGAGQPLGAALEAATAAAEEGMRGTIPLLARKGRASYLGERSIGHQDPGATSAALIVAALARAVAAGS
jgi:dihydroxyacetone kinase-like protein